jgi:hypothetical protein
VDERVPDRQQAVHAARREAREDDLEGQIHGRSVTASLTYKDAPAAVGAPSFVPAARKGLGHSLVEHEQRCARLPRPGVIRANPSNEGSSGAERFVRRAAPRYPVGPNRCDDSGPR